MVSDGTIDLIRFVPVSFRAVVRCFLRNRDVMRMVLPDRCRRHFDKPRVVSQLIDRSRSYVSHPRSQSADQLVDVIAQWPFKRHSPFDSFGYEFVASRVTLSVSLYGSFDHRSH